MKNGSDWTPGFGVRLTASMLVLIVLSVTAVSGILYWQFRESALEAELNELEGLGQASSASVTQWLEDRQGEMRYLATLGTARNLELDVLEDQLEQLAALDGYYDTIFVVTPDGVGQVGVEDVDDVRVLDRQEAGEFQVADREWFQRAIGGEETFSEPVVSRATGSRVSTVAVPIRDRDEVVGVMRGAIDLDRVLEQVGDLDVGPQGEVYLVDRDGLPVTSADSVADMDEPLQTRAARGVQAGGSGVGQYANAAGVDVVGTWSDIPLLGWGLVLEVAEHEALSGVRQVFWMVVAVSGAILLLALGASVLFVRSVARQLGGDPSYAARVVARVAEGDLTADVSVKDGEDHSLLGSVATMQGSLREVIGEIQGSANEVASAATELSQVNEQADGGVEQQNEQLGSVATAMNEMTSTVEEVARNTQAAADASSEVDRLAGSGREEVEQAVTAIRARADEVREASRLMEQLKEESDQIGTVVNVIHEVSEQTNLLALNAAIEAARAGHDGRGFAVVASEVRTLAGRVAESTNEIQGMIGRLQERADEVEAAMARNRDEVEGTVTQAQRADQALEEITRSMADLRDRVSQISSAAEEQATTAQEINRNVHGIQEVAGETARGVKQSREAGEQLAQLAESLSATVKRFRH